jgi:DNA topoisomerase III
VPTPMGIGLIDALPVQSLASPELTGNWEARLARIARGQEARAAFMGDIARYVQEVVDAIRQAAPMASIPIEAQPGRRPAGKGGRRPRKAKAGAGTPPQPNSSPPTTPTAGLTGLRCPACKQGGIITGKRGWGCSRWREGCKFVVWFEENGAKRSLAELRAIVARAQDKP